MNNLELFNNLSLDLSRKTTLKYSTSFSLGIKLLSPKIQKPIYSIYGFVRFADEIVDTFHDYPQREMLTEFKEETYKAIERGISINPILNSFQKVVNHYSINSELIDSFLDSMEMDLYDIEYDKEKYEKYILGSAEVVGLMCLKVFTDGNNDEYEKLKPAAMKLGSAFQKVNFLRDLNFDAEHLGRMYFPNINIKDINEEIKSRIIEEIEIEFHEALQGIKKLSPNARTGVYIAYLYYKKPLNKIKKTNAEELLKNRIRIPNYIKITTIFGAFFRNRLNLI